jgi:hypothetical protein
LFPVVPNSDPFLMPVAQFKKAAASRP